MNPGIWLCVVLAAWLMQTTAAAGAAEPVKMALVIGNSEYVGGQRLPNTINDARLIGDTLRKLGFAVSERDNLGRAQLASAVDDFASRLPRGATAFVYYAGHGMQIDDNNYLTPVDMTLTSSDAAKLSSYALVTLLDRLNTAKSAVNIVVLDACRNNPFQPNRPARYRGFENMGLSQVKPPHGTLIAYSTSPGQLAPDGKGDHSLYTAQLAKMLGRPNTELVTIFRQVADEVQHRTHDEQRPWMQFALDGYYYFAAQDQARYGASVQAAEQPGIDVRRQPSRSLRTSEELLQPWFRTLSVAESNQLDWEIQQRVRHLTPDELPGLQRQAVGGGVVAQTVLGLAYREGTEPIRMQGTQQVARHKANNGLAWKWLKKAAEAGFPMAQAEIGEMYFQGHGTDVNLKESRYWISLAARTGYPRAKLDLVQLQAIESPGDVDFRNAASSLVESIRSLSRPAPSVPQR